MELEASNGSTMGLTAVNLNSDVYLVCLTHALSTEREEIMGLLLGEIDGMKVAQVSSVIILTRSDKQPDRVEISPEQLTAAAEKAEKMKMRVIGWYHSHPHITVFPSHIDVRTQADYQMMDRRFFGLIFSVFNEDKATKQQRIQVICFQSVNQSPEGQPPQYERSEVPMQIVPQPSISRHCLDALVEVPKIFTGEEKEAYFSTTKVKDLDLITQIHNGTVFSKSLCQTMELLTGPLVHSLENRLNQNKREIEELERRKKELEQKLQESGKWPMKTSAV